MLSYISHSSVYIVITSTGKLSVHVQHIYTGETTGSFASVTSQRVTVYYPPPWIFHSCISMHIKVRIILCCWPVMYRCVCEHTDWFVIDHCYWSQCVISVMNCILHASLMNTILTESVKHHQCNCVLQYQYLLPMSCQWKCVYVCLLQE